MVTRREDKEMGFHRRGNRTFWIDVYAHPEDIPIEGNVLASGNDKEDKLAEDLVREELEDGNEWAWCLLQVEVTDMDSENENVVSEYLGGCNYRSKRDFIANSGYYEDMVNECIARLEVKFMKESREEVSL
jgi:hypothetical protein